MTLCKTLSFVAAAAVSCLAAAHAQFAVYGTVTGDRIGGIACPSYAAPCSNTNGSDRPFGGTYGAYYDFRDMGPARIGVDLRGETLVANKRADSSAGGGKIIRHTDVMLGVRASFKTPIHALHPYVEIAGGLDRNNDTGLYTNTTTVLNLVTPVSSSALTYDPNRYTNYGVVKGLVGLDLRLSSIVDFRVIELGLGEAFGSVANLQATTIQQNAAGTVTSQSTKTVTTSSSTHGIQSIGIGLVFRFSR